MPPLGVAFMRLWWLVRSCFWLIVLLFALAARNHGRR